MTDRIGQSVGKYRLTRVLGKGGFAEVYLGTHLHLGSQAAVKLLLAPLASASEIAQFRREAQTIAALVHPNIVRVLDFDVEGDTPYLVMDYAPNGSLRQRLPAATPLPAASLAPVLAQVADALQSAHDQHLVHRDIKPENMLVGRRNEVLLSDFGIAIAAQSTSQQKTQGVAGTAAYMAPEQLQGKPRPASDLYALGVVAYEWLTGTRPFVGSFTEVASQHLFTPPPPLRAHAPDLSPAVEQVVLTALAKDPKERFSSVHAFTTAFIQASEAGSARSVQPVLLPASGDQPTPPWRSQDEGGLPSAATRVATLTGGQSHPAAPSILDAPTHLISPAAATVAPAGNTGMPSGVPAFPGVAEQAHSATSPQASQISGAPPLVDWGGQAIPSAPGASSQEFTESGTFQEAAAGGGGKKMQGGGNLPPGANLPAGRLALPQDSFGRRKGGLQRVVLLAAACLVALALLGGGFAFAFPRLFSSQAGLPPTTAAAGTASSGPATGATVMITPESRDLKDNYTLTAVTGTPDVSKQQVGARVISVTTSAHSESVSATGSGTTPGTGASGVFDVVNGDPANPLNIPRGATFPNSLGCASSGLTIVLDASANLPKASPSGPPYPYAIVSGHVQQAGSIGNFSNNGCHGLVYYGPASCPSNVTGGGVCWSINSDSPFTGGTDPKPYTAVAQSDIDGAANSLITANQPDAQQVVQGQVQSNEQLIGTPQCSPNTSADHKAGDQASQVTVTVTFTCTGEAYDHAGALALANTLLTTQAESSPGVGYALVGQIKTQVTTATPDSQGAVTLTVAAEGVWAYQFNDAQKQSLAGLIAGKSKQEAIQVLQAQRGVAQVAIHLSGGNGQTLPTDPGQITFAIQAVPGA
jgi:VCBS repeat-containing protein